MIDKKGENVLVYSDAEHPDQMKIF